MFYQFTIYESRYVRNAMLIRKEYNIKNGFFLILTLFAIVMFVFLPTSFAQDGATVNLQESVMVNTSAYVVRLIYFLPNDREAQPDIDAILDTRIKKTQQYFADAMEKHGYGRKTFTFESDENGNAIVHHVNGLHNDAYYQNNPFQSIFPEVHQHFDCSKNTYFDLSKNIYFITVEISSDTFDNGTVCGYGADIGYGGHIYVSASGICFEGTLLEGNYAIAHELGHAFGLDHDFSSTDYIMSHSWAGIELSPCYAEWLNVHPYFNSDKVIPRNQDTHIKLLSSDFEETPPYGFWLRFEIDDPDGLYQVQLLTSTIGPSGTSGHPEFVDYKTLSDKNEIVEFVSTNRMLNDVWIFVIDTHGNYIKKRFDIYNSSQTPDSEVVNIPDTNLVSAIRVVLGYTADRQITQFDMEKLQYLQVINQNVNDLTGLEHAVGLTYLYLNGNQIQDLTPISALTQLTTLGISKNQISEISPLTTLTQLKDLYLAQNQIEDINSLSNMTQLKQLSLSNNQIIDITPLSRLTQLVGLSLNNCQINDIAPLSDITQLKQLYLSNNQITDITPLSPLRELAILSLNNCQINDITPLSELAQLKQLYSSNNQITDITPLSRLTELTLLALSNNQITDITPLAQLTKLDSLSLINNQVSDVRPLLRLAKLKCLWIWENPIVDRELLLTLLWRNPGIKIYHRKTGEPLPVSLSHFKAVRAAEGAVINWTTESEQNNAGFNILRSRTQNGEFREVNTKLIQGAGTTGERNEYMWTDTTAKPYTVYYYRIEDVSHAGERKQLATVRLRGFVSPKNKFTISWADLKMQ